MFSERNAICVQNTGKLSIQQNEWSLTFLLSVVAPQVEAGHERKSEECTGQNPQDREYNGIQSSVALVQVFKWRLTWYRGWHHNPTGGGDH